MNRKIGVFDVFPPFGGDTVKEQKAVKQNETVQNQGKCTLPKAVAFKISIFVLNKRFYSQRGSENVAGNLQLATILDLKPGVPELFTTTVKSKSFSNASEKKRTYWRVFETILKRAYLIARSLPDFDQF
jgi:hypothetical protein